MFGEATISGGTATLDLELRVVADDLRELTKNVTLILLPSDAYDVVGASATVEIRDCFSIVYAWGGYPTANETAKVSVPLSTSYAASEVARFESFIASLTTILDYDPSAAPGSSASASETSISREFDVQTTPEPAANSTATASLSIGAQSDWDVLRNLPIPEIAFPTLDGEAIDLSRDVALLQTLDDVSDAYDAAVRAAQNA